jgi:hypothetical protein
VQAIGAIVDKKLQQVTIGRTLILLRISKKIFAHVQYKDSMLVNLTISPM